MRKFLLLALGASTLAFAVSPAQAQDTLIIDDGNDSVIEGIVKNVRYKEIIIDVSGKEIKVETDDLNIGNNADEYFPVGTKVQVVGQIVDEDEINARKMIRLDLPATPEVEVVPEQTEAEQ